MPVAAIRGATSLDSDTVTDVVERTRELLLSIFERNEIGAEDVISIIFTATDDVTAEFPAVAARTVGLSAVPLLCARELAIDGALPRCVRVLLHVDTDRPRTAFQHVYLHDTRSLRPDLG